MQNKASREDVGKGGGNRVFAESGSDARGFRMHGARCSIQFDRGVHGMFLFLLIISARLTSRAEMSRVPAQRPGRKTLRELYR